MKRITLLGAAVSLLVGGQVYAEAATQHGLGQETTSDRPQPDRRQGHAYLGVRAGWASFHGFCESDSLSCSNDTFGYGLYGGYQFNDWLGLEAGGTSYGTPDSRYPAGKVEAETYGAELAFKLGYPLTDNAELFTRLGGGYQRIDKTYSPRPDTLKSRDWNPMASVGVDYRLSQRWSLRGEYQFIDGVGNNATDKADLHFTSLGVTYHFGQQAPAAHAPVEMASVVEPKAEPQMPVAPAPRYVMVEKTRVFDSEALFDVGSAVIKDTSPLLPLVDQIKRHDQGAIMLIGYSDSTGPAAYNLRLSEARAQSVADYLEQQGVVPSRLSVKGLGEANPVASNDSPEGRAKNRRVEVRFTTTVRETRKVTSGQVGNQ
jgi:OOP family OmpA-OmpF porin